MATNLEFIKSASGNGVTTIEITDCFSDKYDVYEVLITGNGSQNVNALAFAYLDTGGSLITSGVYDTAILRLEAGAVFGESRTTSQNYTYCIYTGSTDRDFAHKMTVYNPYSNSSYTFATFQNNSNLSMIGEKGISVAKTTTQAQGIRFYANQQFTPVKLSVYGVK